MGILKQCFICQNKNLYKFLDFGSQPPSDAFLRADALLKPEATYPLALYFCEECALVQLGYIVPPGVLFTEYVYTTGMNNSLRANFKEFVKILVQKFRVTANDFVIDIGSNDGTLLENYIPYGINMLGVDPSSAAEIAVKRNIQTIRDFFDTEVAKRIQKEYGQAKIITATNVFAHVPALDSFMAGIRMLLTKDGVFVSESGYLLDMIETLGYDAIYHEHLRYYSLKPLVLLFAAHDLEIFDVERIPSHSGSIRVYAARRGAREKNSSVDALLALEEKKGLYDRKTFTDFARRVEDHREVLKRIVRDIKSSGRHIVGLGAPAKGNTLLNYCGFSSEHIEYLAEKSGLKIGLFAPGSHIPVVSEKRMLTTPSEYALVLSWNLAEELILNLRQKGFKGKFIIPFPQPRIAH